MKKAISIFVILLFCFNGLTGQEAKTMSYYKGALNEMKLMLEDSIPLNFKRSVFLTENAFYDGKLDYEKFDKVIRYFSSMVDAYRLANPLPYKGSDYENVAKNYAIYKFMTDTIWLTKDTALHYPYSYNFDDFAGKKDWASMFVTNLIQSRKGNCHSMPFLYKMIAEEIGAGAYLSLAPYHMYIKTNSEKYGWFNTELTNGMFPVDAWVAASGYVSLDAIRNGIYMDPLSLKQSIAFCLYDLAKGCERKHGFQQFPFIFGCLNLALEHYPNFINALLYKSECLKQRFDIYMTLYGAESFKDILDMETPKEIFTEMEKLYAKILGLGFREMPPEMYKEWMASLIENKEKYENNEILINFKQE